LDKAEEVDTIERNVKDIADGELIALVFANTSRDRYSVALRVDLRVTPFGEKLTLSHVDLHHGEHGRQYFELSQQDRLIDAMNRATQHFLRPTPIRQKLLALQAERGAPPEDFVYTWHRLEATPIVSPQVDKKDLIAETAAALNSGDPVITLGEQTTEDHYEYYEED
jgi:hypothetical protein